MRDAVVYDIDNTLIDVRRRLYICLKEASNGRKIYRLSDLTPEERDRFWEIFLSPKYIYLDRPIKETIEEVNAKYDSGLYVIILTGRPENMYRVTISQLNRYGVKFHRIYMRPIHDKNPDYIYKPSQISRILAENFNILEYHDDSISALERVSQLYPNIHTCRHGFGDFL
ncbi:MAG TPA: hypothetical protein EYH44_04305 [Thermoprotei archaeon]|nr:hypothetical protein [Thermoprotei archaeon]